MDLKEYLERVWQPSTMSALDVFILKQARCSVHSEIYPCVAE